MALLCENRNEKGKELRAVVVETIQDMMKTDDSIVALEADLGGASKFTDIEKSNPDRFVQCGIAEANMVGVAAGLSATGFKPFMHTFGPFASRRVFDQIFLAGAYADNNINIYGSDPGFCAGPNGGTHTTFEDVALLSSIPNTRIYDAADAVQLEWIVRECAKQTKGVNYFRANRKNVRNIYEKGTSFETGVAKIVRPGSDILVITAGQILADALDCAEKLEKEGISVEVVDMFCLKPFDAKTVLKEIEGKKAVISFENHQIHGGLGSMVAETLAEANVNIKFKRHGINDLFGQVGSQEFLQAEFKLTAQDLEETIKKVLED